MEIKKGFTLIEMLVVITIIGILAAIVTVNVDSARKKSRDAKRIADITEIRDALELYADGHNGKYPVPASTRARTDGVQGSWSDLAASLVPNYIQSLPIDPKNTLGTYFYGYETDAGGAGYLLYAYQMETEEGRAKAAADNDSDTATSSLAPSCGYPTTCPLTGKAYPCPVDRYSVFTGTYGCWGW